MTIVNGITDMAGAFPGFRYRRGVTPLGGYIPAMDPVTAAELETLERYLRTPAVDPADANSLTNLLAAPLETRRAGPSDISTGEWPANSLVDKLRDETKKAKPGRLPIGEAARSATALSDLALELAEELTTRQDELTLNQRVVLAGVGVRDLLFARATVEHGIGTIKSLINFVLHDPHGVDEVARYVAVSAAREYVLRESLRVVNIDKDDNPVVNRVRATLPLFSADTFRNNVVAIAGQAINDSRYDEFITAAKLGSPVPASVKPRLIEYIKTSGVVTKANAPFTIPYYLAKAASEAASETSTGQALDSTAPDDPFRVTFSPEDADVLEVSTNAVKCASQLYYVMTLGDELGVFEAVRHFTHRYLFRQGFAVEDKVLRRDLENYVFSEQFTGLDTVDGERRLMRCTREPERRTFYRQVFDHGDEPLPDDAPANSDFRRLWKILVLESARYLERVSASPHPDFVSAQSVLQAVEDLQQNLSSSCVGMATVMTPLMYAELDFVKNKILGHPEVRRHLVPGGGSWLKVVERLGADRNRRMRAPLFNNKAQLGYTLIRDIAAYTPSKFEQERTFNGFMSNMEAFITTQSIIQEEYDEGDLHVDARSNGRPGMPGLPTIPGLPEGIPGMPSMPWGSGGGSGDGGQQYAPAPTPSQVGANGGSSADEWDF